MGLAARVEDLPFVYFAVRRRPQFERDGALPPSPLALPLRLRQRNFPTARRRRRSAGGDRPTVGPYHRKRRSDTRGISSLGDARSLKEGGRFGGQNSPDGGFVASLGRVVATLVAGMLLLAPLSINNVADVASYEGNYVNGKMNLILRRRRGAERSVAPSPRVSGATFNHRPGPASVSS